MRETTNELHEYLRSNDKFVLADLYDVVLRSGEILRWAGHDSDLEWDGSFPPAAPAPVVYKAARWPCVPALTRGTTRITRGPQVDTLDITVGTAGAVNLGGIPMPRAVLQGAVDGAKIRLRRAFLRAGAIVPNPVVLFAGEVQGQEPASTEVKLTVKSILDKGTTMVPSILFMPSCPFAVYDARCTLSRGSFTVSGSVTATPTPATLETDLTAVDDYFALGVIAMTSGAANGTRTSVSAYKQANGLITLSVPMRVSAAPGDTFDIYPGCDKKVETCDVKFSNKIHFGGYPYVPKQEEFR